MAMSEREQFDAWLAGQSGRVTGWMVWCASLVARQGDMTDARPAFDLWLSHARATEAEWDLFDAWLGAAEWDAA